MRARAPDAMIRVDAFGRADSRLPEFLGYYDEQGKQMAKKENKLNAELRVAEGSNAAGRLRRSGMIPAAINRIGGDTTLVKFDAHTFEGMLRHHTSEHFIVTLVLDGQEIPALLREVQHDVLNSAVIHVDFGEVSLVEKIHVSIPVVLLGEPVGVRVGGGMLEHTLREIEVGCLPADVVEQFEVDSSALNLGESLFVRDLKLGEKYTLYTEENSVIATVVDPAAAAAASDQRSSAAADTGGEGAESAEKKSAG
jgi:large subunit ribosomal protein L25